jgi:hypothetical protein
MAELPVMPATTRFVAAMATLAAIAPWMASFEFVMRLKPWHRAWGDSKKR